MSRSAYAHVPVQYIMYVLHCTVIRFHAGHPGPTESTQPSAENEVTAVRQDHPPTRRSSSTGVGGRESTHDRQSSAHGAYSTHSVLGTLYDLLDDSEGSPVPNNPLRSLPSSFSVAVRIISRPTRGTFSVPSMAASSIIFFSMRCVAGCESHGDVPWRHQLSPQRGTPFGASRRIPMWTRPTSSASGNRPSFSPCISRYQPERQDLH